MSKAPTLGVVIPIYKRRDLAALCLRWWAALVSQFPGDQIRVVIVGSEGEDSLRVFAEAKIRGGIYIEHPNQPLGQKWNAGIAKVLRAGVDGVAIYGSNEFPDRAMVNALLEGLEKGYDYQGWLDNHVIDLLDPEPSVALFQGYPHDSPRYGEPVSGGRCLSRWIVEKWEGRIYDPATRVGLDSTMTRRINATTPRRERFLRMADVGAVYLDVRLALGVSTPGTDVPDRYADVGWGDVLDRVFYDGFRTALLALGEGKKRTIDAVILCRGNASEGLEKTVWSLDGQGIRTIHVRVDTRFTSHAARVARELGCEVYTHPVPLYDCEAQHPIHFAKTRNDLESCSDADWLLIIDADEILLEGPTTLIQEIVRAEELGGDGVGVDIRAVDDQGGKDSGPQSRLVKNGSWRWRFPAHNQHIGGKHLILGRLSIRSEYHSGAGRHERSVPMLLKLYADGDPDSGASRGEERLHSSFHLAGHYWSQNLYTDVEKWAQRAIDIEPDVPELAPVWTWLAIAKLSLHGLDDAIEVVEKALEYHQGYPDLYWFRGAFAIAKAGEVDGEDPRYSMTRTGIRDRLHLIPEIMKRLGLPIAIQHSVPPDQ